MSHSQASLPSNNNSTDSNQIVVTDGLSVQRDAQITHIFLQKIDKNITDLLLQEFAMLRKTNKSVVVLHIDNVTVERWGENITQRLKWSRIGQVLRNYIQQASHYTIAVLSGENDGEPYELASFCDHVFIRPGAKHGFNTFPMWGSLQAMLKAGAPLENYFTGQQSLFEEKPLKNDTELDQHIDDILKTRKDWSPLAKNLQMIVADEFSHTDVAENVTYANSEFFKDFQAIEYLNQDQFLDRVFEIDDYKDLLVRSENNRVEMSRYTYGRRRNPVQRIKTSLALNEYQVTKLLEQQEFPIKGKCIELGAESGYFSMMLSKSPEVEEVIACEINPSTIFWSTPAAAEKLQPNWQKMRYLICDFDEVPGDGTFDVVVFCCSLNCSPDENASLQKAYRLLKPGGLLILHDEHVYPAYFHPKANHLHKNNPRNYPVTSMDFFSRLEKAGFKPHIFPNVLPGKRFPEVKKFLLERSPLKYLNGYFLYAQLNIIGVKPK